MFGLGFESGFMCVCVWFVCADDDDDDGEEKMMVGAVGGINTEEDVKSFDVRWRELERDKGKGRGLVLFFYSPRVD